MVSLIAAPNQLRLSRATFLPVNSTSVFVVSLATRQALPGSKRNQTLLQQDNQSFRVVQPREVVRRCKPTQNEDYSALEQEVLEFMLHSQDPDRFPSRKDLINAGRRDLAEAILKRGGWMTRGWDLPSDGDSEKAELDALLIKWNSGSANLGRSQQMRESKINGAVNSVPSSTELRSVNGFANLRNSHPPASSSGRSGETEASEDAGIEGILNRLEKQRNLSLGIQMERKANSVFSKKNQLHARGLEAADSSYSCNDAKAGMSRENKTLAIQEKILREPIRGDNLKNVSNLNGSRNTLKPDTWRTWSIQRAGFPGGDFEAAEINFDHSGKATGHDSQTDQIVALHKGDKEQPLEMIENFKPAKFSGDDIRSRLHSLELELSSALRMLKSNTGGVPQKVDNERLSEDYLNLSDELEFQENEVIKSQDKLRSLRARLAVLEGKVAMEKLDSQKGIDEKLNRINESRKALHLLRTTCVVWPNSASEVLLAGSFDGWTTKRKMEKSRNGIFSLWLRLYPGRYEIKFIVDGMWKVDALRPIVNGDGYENNQLIIV